MDQEAEEEMNLDGEKDVNLVIYDTTLGPVHIPSDTLALVLVEPHSDI